MRITHLCLACFFPDGYSYQENMLPKYHKKLGHEVSVIASLQTYDKDGHLKYMDGPKEYLNEYGIPVYRLCYQKPEMICKKVKRYVGTYDALEKTDPEILFIHGCQFMDVAEVVRYKKKHPNLKVFVDNHADYKNSAKSFISKQIMHGILWKAEARKLLSITEKFYGVLPARVDFLKDVYRLPDNKVDLLCIGADDEFVLKYSSTEARTKTRTRYGYSDDDFVIITGGKINSNRPETLELMKTVINCSKPKLKLLIFGVVEATYKPIFDELSKNDKIDFIGWLSPEETYENIAASDLVVFPGLHSVMWEQAVAQGIPCLFRKIPGFDHVDIGGNAYFCEDVSERGLSNALNHILGDKTRYEKMKKAANKSERKQFYYSEIARRCIEC